MATVSTLTPWQSQLLLNFPVWLSSDCKAGELGCTYSHAENDQEGENNMNEYEEELLEQRAQEWDDAVDDAQAVGGVGIRLLRAVGAAATGANSRICCRSTRPGCECVPAQFAPRAVLLHQTTPSRIHRRTT